MPGLVGVVGARGPAECRTRFEAAVTRMLRHEGMGALSYLTADGECLTGHVYLSDTPRKTPPEPACVSDILVLFHGVLYNEDELLHDVETMPGMRELPPSRDASADRRSPRGGGRLGLLNRREALLRALYLKHGTGFAARLEGEFCVAVVDPKQHTVLFATDPVGNYPLYWQSGSDGLVFASDLSAVLRASTEAPRLNLAAVGDYLTAGAVLGKRTLADGVELLDPGTVLTFHTRERRVSQQVYDSLDAYFAPRAITYAAYIEEVQSAFTRAVDRALAGPGQAGLSLSGGLDSRAILSAVNGRAPSLQTYTLGIEGCADQQIAGRLAAIARTKHHYFALDDRYLRDFLPNMARMVSMTDGMYLSHGLTEMLALQFLGTTGISVLLRGHGGELAKAHLAWPLHTDPHVYTLGTPHSVARYLSGRANYITQGLPLDTFMTADALVKASGGAGDTYTALLEHASLSPAAGCSYLYLRELTRRFTVPSLELFRTQVEVRLPYLNTRFLKVLLAVPPEWRDTTRIHRALTATGIPKLLKVRNSNSGAPADAGPLRELVMDKVNSALKRLNVRGFRHYHNFDDWMRTQLLESVEAELLSPRARILNIVSRPALTKLIADTREGRADRSYLLQILLILELWQHEHRVEAAA